MSILIKKFKPHSSGALKGFLDIEIPKMGLQIFGCSVFKKGDNVWASLPSREYKDKEGQTKYLPVIRWTSEDMFKAFSKSLSDTILAYLTSENIDLENPQAPQQNMISNQTSSDVPF